MYTCKSDTYKYVHVQIVMIGLYIRYVGGTLVKGTQRGVMYIELTEDEQFYVTVRKVTMDDS